MDSTEVVNLGLIKLGDGELLATLTGSSRKATLAQTLYNPVRKAELRAHPWNFAKKRIALAADGAAPEFGFSYRYTLPADFIRLHPDACSDDWTIENGFVLTDDSAPLEVVYIYDHEDPNAWDALYLQAVATRIALELCQWRTASNTKKDNLKDDYRAAIAEARRVNSIENISAEQPEDSWISVRR